MRTPELKTADGQPRTESGQEPASTEQWSPVMAECAARIYGIYPLGARQWKAIGATREEFLRSGSTPALSTLCNICGLRHSELAELFPDTCITLYALAGVPAPRAAECTDPTPARTDAETSNTDVNPDK